MSNGLINMRFFQNKNVVITGSGSGIGKMLALQIASLGGHVVVWDLRESATQETLQELRASGHRATAVACDVRDREAVERTAGELIARLGHIDVLINNAGIVSGKELLDLEPAEIIASFQTNILAHFWTLRAFLPHMISRGKGNIVTIASAAGLAGAPKLADYAATKFAAMGLDDVLRAELSTRAPAIRTTVVCPFFIKGEMFRGVKSRFNFLLPVLKPEYVTRRILSAVARGRKRLILPRIVYLNYPLRLLPVSVFDYINRVLGVHAAMRKFVGKGSSGELPLLRAKHRLPRARAIPLSADKRKSAFQPRKHPGDRNSVHD